ncbi:FA83D protein, partial [Amia calva]|nr:FA83D protein [Amia calva]
MALSQCLDDFPFPALSPGRHHLKGRELYKETHRLALEELIVGGRESYIGFLKTERIPGFLSEEEIGLITDSVVVPKSVSLSGDEAGVDQSVSSSMDCSSVTYFPEVSDVEPPLLEIGWPAFTTGSYRGVTRAVAHFQPSYGDCIYSCKEAARRMIKSAKELIALVTDSLTDLDIFQDLHEACTKRKLPVYILLDQSSVPAFLQMCKTLDIQLEDLQQMRVRTLTGATYFTRSGAKIVGKVHERFMLIDGNRVATGSYRFNWTDGKLNSSNLIELSGQISETFDEEFRILYAESKPLNPKALYSQRNSGIYDHLFLKVAPGPEPPKPHLVEPSILSSTPKRAQTISVLPGVDDGELLPKDSRMSEASTIGEDWLEKDHVEEVLTAHEAPTESSMQTDVAVQETETTFTTSATQTASQDLVSSMLDSQISTLPKEQSRAFKRAPANHSPSSPDGSLRDCFNKLTKERQYHYSTIRSKLDHMVALLSHRRELVDLTNLAFNPGHYKLRKAHEQREQNQLMRREAPRLVPLIRSRCLK